MVTLFCRVPVSTAFFHTLFSKVFDFRSISTYVVRTIRYRTNFLLTMYVCVWVVWVNKMRLKRLTSGPSVNISLDHDVAYTRLKI